jgi:uncharacterized RDD family membrane protein YckC
MTEPFQEPEPGGQPPPPQPSYPGYGYQQQGYGYSYGPEVSNYASFGRRAGALLLDYLILNFVLLFFGGLGRGTWTLAILNLVIVVGYFSIMEGVRGQTVGAMVANVRVVDADAGQIIGIPRAILRNLVRLLSGLVVGLGYFWMLWDKRKQTWHDHAAGSVVVRTS